MKVGGSMTLAAGVAALACLGAAITAAQEAGADADRGAVVTDPVIGSEQNHPGGKPSSSFYAADLIGHTVENRRSAREVGRVSNLVIDKDGNVVAILVDRSDEKNGGKRAIAIGWDEMDRVVADDKLTLTIDMDEKALEALPEHTHI